MSQENWIEKLFLILLSHGSVILAGYLLIRFVRHRCSENDSSFDRTFFHRFLRNFVVGRQSYNLVPTQEPLKNGAPTHEGTRSWNPNDCCHLVFYFIGIENTLVCMGYFQERIVTRSYAQSSSQNVATGGGPLLDRFEDTQFLVLANRFMALILSGLYMAWTWRSQPVHSPPFYLHAFSSLSNVIARRQRYNNSEYVLAIVLAVGASLFFISMSSGDHSSHASKESVSTLNSTTSDHWYTFVDTKLLSTISGLVLMVSYLAFDAFTPNWQKKMLDKAAQISTTQMMFAVNSFSVLFCLVSLLQQWTLLSSINFLLTHDRILIDCLLLSLGSSCGQVFIYMTINRFGPVILSVLMTLRQIFSILLSSISFGHPLTAYGIFGLVLTFGAIFVDTFRKYRGNTRASLNNS